METFDIAVVGGGASGLCAAITAAERGARTVLLEAQARTGRRLLATGNGKCNITNRLLSADMYNTDCPETVGLVLSEIDEAVYEDFFLKTGIPFMTGQAGRVYPMAESAAAVLDMLRLRLDASGTPERCGARVEKITKKGGGFELYCGERIAAAKVIIAAGGTAAPSLGGCGDGIKLLSSFGHGVVPPRPSLTAVKVESPSLGALKGTRIHCRLSLVRNGKPVYEEDGELQFNQNALSGVAVFNISSRLTGSGECICADLLPELTAAQTLDMLRQRRKLAGVSKGDFLLGMLSKRPAQCLMKEAGTGNPERPAGTLTDSQLERLAGLIKRWRFPVTGTDGMDKAQVMRGGIPLAEFDSGMQSKKQSGVYACGEVLNCDGQCGGYNLRWAFSTGIMAGRNAAASLQRHRRETK